jgi:hypothetical protein
MTRTRIVCQVYDLLMKQPGLAGLHEHHVAEVSPSPGTPVTLLFALQTKAQAQALYTRPCKSHRTGDPEKVQWAREASPPIMRLTLCAAGGR